VADGPRVAEPTYSPRLLPIRGTFTIGPKLKHLTSLAFLATLALQTRADDQRENNSLSIDPSRASSKAVIAPTVERDDPAMAVVQLDIHPKLAANLFASEPMMTNPASIDVDDMGRVWVCEAINYRAFRNADVLEDRQEGDRIIVLEDSDFDAKADKKTVFYQGHDVDSAHGVMVMPARRGKGTKAIVSALDSVFFLIDDDGDLKADRKELLFTGIDGVQHDHGIHAFHFGPDGKLYFNIGNAGKHIKDQKGVPIIDKMGHEVNDSRNPYQEGMAFRCNLDGSEFETLAWNFRNNWEICVDSFGTIWQSDNDDDGNQSCRINYVMEFGNYGYKDELTGAAWTEPRTNWEKEVPQRHWHLNDPGVIPNLLQTGAGAPTGICVYEGELLSQQFRGAILHTDAGRNVCRAYMTKTDGAGYTATTANIVDGERNKWFRPSDVCVAPDGSLFVADWNDPGVGGHRMEDIRRGRIFRVTPQGRIEKNYKAPAVDVTTPAGAVAALKSPNMATRYLAWTALHRLGEKAESALHGMWNSDNPVFRARAMWALGKLGLSKKKSAAVVRNALQENNSDLRVAGLRLARQLSVQLYLAHLQDAAEKMDTSPAPRRELLIGMHEVKPESLPPGVRDEVVSNAWAQLAQYYDGNDRWYLEALGIAADGRWDACLSALRRNVGEEWNSNKAGRDILWRSRGSNTSEQIAAVIRNPSTPTEETPRFFRALDFQPEVFKQQVLPSLAFGEYPNLPRELVFLIRFESISRLRGLDVSRNARYRAMLEDVLDQCAESEQFVRIVDKFNLTNHYAELLTLAQSKPESQLAVDALRVLFAKGQSELLGAALSNDVPDVVERTLIAMATAGDPRGSDLLVSLFSDTDRPLAARRLAVKALGASTSGSERLLDMAQRHDYPSEVQEAFAAALNSSGMVPVRDAAATLFPPPPTRDSTPLPPLRALIEMKGDGERGKVAFNSIGTCAKCHLVDGVGKDIGPDLSVIGDKLARQAMFESILYPSAAISHNFETSRVTTDDGLTRSGILVSESDTEAKLKDENGIIHTIPVNAIEERSKIDASLMPSDIQKLLSAQELVDVVEYLSTLKAKK
jgi:putative membrane-bound dehydrogenase-like protein